MAGTATARAYLFLTHVGQVVKRVFAAIVVVIVAGLLIAGVQQNWASIVCWINDESGSLSRTCAQQKVGESGEYADAEIMEVTGIADINENVKRVEFKWRTKPSSQAPNPKPVDGTMTFRKYDDGWRVAE
jgi:hypothetical protein